MSLPGFEFGRVDWTNAVYIPLILAVPVAAAVAIYTGIVVTRMVAFQTFKLDAVKEISRLRKTLFATENLLAALVELTQFLEAPKIGFASEDQWAAAHRMREIGNRLRHHFKERFEAAAAISVPVTVRRRSVTFDGRQADTAYGPSICLLETA
jgi:hypothetical protein